MADATITARSRVLVERGAGLRAMPLAHCEVCGEEGPSLRCQNYADCGQGHCLFCLSRYYSDDTDHQEALHSATYACEDCCAGALILDGRFPVMVRTYLAAGALILTERLPDSGAAAQRTSSSGGGGGEAGGGEAGGGEPQAPAGFLEHCMAEGRVTDAALHKHSIHGGGLVVLLDTLALRYVPAADLLALAEALAAAQAAHLAPANAAWGLLLSEGTYQAAQATLDQLAEDGKWSHLCTVLDAKEVSTKPPNPHLPQQIVRDAAKVFHVRRGTVRHVIILQPRPGALPPDAADDRQLLAVTAADVASQRTVHSAYPDELLRLLQALAAQPS